MPGLSEPLFHPQHIACRIHCCVCLNSVKDKPNWATYLVDTYAVCDEHVAADLPPKPVRAHNV